MKDSGNTRDDPPSVNDDHRHPTNNEYSPAKYNDNMLGVLDFLGAGGVFSRGWEYFRAPRMYWDVETNLRMHLDLGKDAFEKLPIG